MRVFISHSSKDKAAVLKLAEGLIARGLKPWVDKWEIKAGDDIVASINAGLDEADAGIIVFSEHSRESRWIEAEVSYLTFARIEERKVLIPVMAGNNCYVPALLRSLARRSIDEIDAIADALFNRTAKPVPAPSAEQGRIERVRVSLTRVADAGIQVNMIIGNETHGKKTLAELPTRLVAAQSDFVRGFRHGLRRDLAAADRQAHENHMAELGRELGALCFPGESGFALLALVNGVPAGMTIEVCWEADDPELLGLPFEASRLPDGSVLALQPTVVTMRRPRTLAARATEPLAGPLKILVAVGAPDEGQSSGAVLDQERELQNILDAVDLTRHNENCEVRILEVGHPEVIGKAMEADAYHVLHLSCHGLPGAIELEDEEGNALAVSAADLLEPIRRAGRPLPLVLLNLSWRRPSSANCQSGRGVASRRYSRRRRHAGAYK